MVSGGGDGGGECDLLFYSAALNSESGSRKV